MLNKHQPPYTLSREIVNPIAEISLIAGGFSFSGDSQTDQRFFQINRKRIIMGTQAIEDNTHSEEQITDILLCRLIAALPHETQETGNAIETCDRIRKRQPYDSGRILEALKESRLSDQAGGQVVSLIRELILIETGNADLLKKLWLAHLANF
jgi:hypothetical protein